MSDDLRELTNFDDFESIAKYVDFFNKWTRILYKHNLDKYEVKSHNCLVPPKIENIKIEISATRE